MNALDIVVALGFIILAFMTMLLMSLHERFMKTVKSKDLNVLLVMNSHLVRSMGLAILVLTTMNLWRACLGPLNKVVFIMTMETFHGLVCLTLLLVALTVLLKIGLTVSFDRVHNEDPEALGRKGVASSLAPTLLMMAANVTYILATGRTVHANAFHYTGHALANGDTKHPNPSFKVLGVVFLACLTLMLAEKAIAWFYLHRRCPERIRRAEGPLAGRRAGSEPDIFSIRNLIRGVGLLILAAISVVVKVVLLKKNFEEPSNLLLFQMAQTAVLLGVMANFTLHRAMKSYLKRRLRQWSANESQKPERVVGALGGAKVGPRR